LTVVSVIAQLRP